MHDTSIYQQLSGRLGNQLFQWAYGHQLNSRYQKRIIPFHDKSHAISGYLGDLESLIQPCGHVDTVRQIDILGVLLKGFDKMRSYFPGLTRRLEFTCGISRATNHFEVTLPAQQKTRLVTGFFVNWQTVLGIEGTLFTELTEGFRNIRTPPNLPRRYQVIHVRRGDFLSLKDSYGILHPEFYVANADTTLPTFICTDDTDLAQDIQSQLTVQEVFGPNDLSPMEALKLMANSSSLIMSNSTLSWWAGFYCARKGGQVVIPKPFYKIEELGSLYHPDFMAAPSVFY
jgi:hypothetical protein